MIFDENDIDILQSWFGGWSIGEQETRGGHGTMCIPGNVSYNDVREFALKLGLDVSDYDRKMDEFHKRMEEFNKTYPLED